MAAITEILSQGIQVRGLILGFVFLAITLLVLAIFSLIRHRKTPADRLEKILPNHAPPKEGRAKKATLMEKESTGLVAKVTTPLHKVVLPGHEATRSRIRRELIQAGFRSRQAFRNYLGIKALLAITLPLAFLLRSAFVQLTPQVFGFCLFLALAGFYLPNLVLRYLIAVRQSEILRALPDALDLMVICVEAGLGLDMTFKRVGDEIRLMSPHLSDEFTLVNQEVRAGRARDDAYKSLSTRTGVREIHNLMAILSQTSRFGTSMAQALRVHADAMRVHRRQKAEEIAAKAAVKLLFPLVFFIFPAMLVVMLGPAVIRIARVLLPIFSG